MRFLPWLLVLATRAGAADNSFRDTTLTFEKRTADLVSQLTFEEKCAQLHVHVEANTRLGLPAIDWWTEANHGLSSRGPAGPVTVFPQAIGMAATFDPPIVKQIGDATATEAHARFMPGGVRYRGLVLWAPTINLARDPRWGRVEETYGEDPYLTGRMAVAMCQGMQGDDPKYLKAIAVPKHMAVHSGDRTRMSGSNNAPEWLIRDYYLPAFRDAFVEGHAQGTMTAFSAINGVPNTANPWLLTQVLQKEWGFTGMVTSDNGGVQQVYTSQHFVSSEVEAVAACLNAGLTILANFDSRDFTPEIRQAVQQHLLTQATIDKAASRNLLLRFRMGEFDPPSMNPYNRIPATALGSKENVALALKTAQEAFVLLKNDPAPKGSGFDRLLPLDLRRINSVALIGNRITSRPQFGAYSGVPANPSPSFVEGLRTALGDRVTLRTSGSGGDDSIALARSSDVVIFLGGLSMDMEHEGMDRNEMTLPFDQTSLLTRLLPANQNLIVVLEGGSSMDLQWVKDHAPAALAIWYSGEQGANALAQVLTGQVNPSGRLPVTFYRSAADLGEFEDYDITHGKTYWYLPANKAALFPFGHGLSYTSFEYQHVNCPATAAAGDTLAVALDLANTGKRDGDEVVQVYVTEKTPPAGSKRPLKQLKAFQRVTVAAGKSSPVKIMLPVASLGFWNGGENKYVVDPGVYDVQIGSSSQDIRVHATLIVK